MSTNEGAFPLDNLPVGGQATIVSLEGGKGLMNRLASLGFVPGQKVDMAQNFGNGPLIVTVRGARVALGRGEARRILVKEV